ncbi:hypothetical protein PMAYCL1PPCAC_10094, partial [Pristionchus mayeri]
ISLITNRFYLVPSESLKDQFLTTSKQVCILTNYEQNTSKSSEKSGLLRLDILNLVWCERKQVSRRLEAEVVTVVGAEIEVAALSLHATLVGHVGVLRLDVLVGAADGNGATARDRYLDIAVADAGAGVRKQLGVLVAEILAGVGLSEHTVGGGISQEWKTL